VAVSRELFTLAARLANDYRERVGALPVGIIPSRADLLTRVPSELPEVGEPAEVAVRALAAAVEPGLVHSTSPRYFGFVIGGSTPASVAADWLTSAWDQSGQVFATSPASAIVEEVVSRWLLDLLQLPSDAGVGLVTGAQMANFTALVVARNTVLRRHGWNVDADGLQDAPHITVACGECCHATVHAALRLMGLGTRNVIAVGVDEQGRMRADALEAVLDACTGPTIVCAQAGNVNTGAFDPFPRIAALARTRGAWLHVDGAFGLWAAASPRFSYLTAGVQLADSWTVDAHKWLNVPYDSGVVMVRDRDAHRSLKAVRCAYAGTPDAATRDGSDWVPENSRRARGFVLYAALRNLGRSGVRRLVDSCCDAAMAFASRLRTLPHARVLNDVVLNQVLCRFEPPGADDVDTFNAAVAARVQREGVCWLGTTRWQGQTAIRISVSNSETTIDDIDASIAGISRALEACRADDSGI
jgi:glutamate/tyrosine decarboxylase-like PLP-dependent enzyme